ncbi:cytochrome P450 [Ammonicoccus fulvus]|uniref:Cytochrome P450 n=1 Tax=Ammonicoccus fulvus TaxID=3138240 RepID=A0ABZ3FSE6_9ACTN
MTAPTVSYPFAEWLITMSRLRGSVFFGWLGRPYAYLIGPEANEFVFSHDTHFRQREAFKGLIPVDGPTSVVVSDGEDHTRRRGLVRPGLHHRKVAGYVATMSRTAEEALDGVRPGETFDAYGLFRSAIRRSTMRALFGDRMAEQADVIGANLQPLMDLTDLLPDLVGVHERLRTGRWRRAMAAKEEIDRFVYAEIARLRDTDAEAESQVLATLVHGRDGTGSGLSDEEVRDQVVTLIAAGYETTSAAMGWALYGLGGRPELIEQARAEVLEVTGGAAPTMEQLPQLKLVGAVISEALRLYPPGSISARYVVQELEFGGKRIKPGTMLIYSPYATHRTAAVFDRPLEFRPERWLEDGFKPALGEYVPFGGGVHRCLGSTMATTELTVMLACLLARGSFALEPQKVRATGMSSMRPRDGVRITLRETAAIRP